MSSEDMDTSVLLTSCVLVSAYNLLRGDVKAADRSLESGLKMLSHVQPIVTDTSLNCLSRILVTFGNPHGFKLWAPDITFRIDRTVAGREHLDIITDFPKGPFVNTHQVLTAFKNLMVENVAKPMRNLSLGAHIDPGCLLAQTISRNFSDVFFHWDLFHRSLSNHRQQEKLELMQIKIGLLSARILFNTKIIESNEVRDNEHIQSYAEIVAYGKEIIAARAAGRPVIYMDRIVNGALYTSSLFCRDPRIKRQMISLLKSQIVYTEGLVDFLRGHVSELVAEIEEFGIAVNSCHDVPESKRVRVSHLQCREDRVLRMQYMLAAQTTRADSKEHFSKLPPSLNRFDHNAIDNCLQGMSAAYTMYKKVDVQTAPRGYLRKMYYRGRPVRVTWRADLLQEGQVE